MGTRNPACHWRACRTSCIPFLLSVCRLHRHRLVRVTDGPSTMRSTLRAALSLTCAGVPRLPLNPREALATGIMKMATLHLHLPRRERSIGRTRLGYCQTVTALGACNRPTPVIQRALGMELCEVPRRSARSYCVQRRLGLSMMLLRHYRCMRMVALAPESAVTPTIQAADFPQAPRRPWSSQSPVKILLT